MIIDSKTLVFKSYKKAGVVMPESSWGLPWQDWLPLYFKGDFDHARKVHERKNELYLKEIKNGRMPLLSGAEVIKRVAAARDLNVKLCIYTGAARAVADLIVDQLGLGDVTVGSSMTTQAKSRMLANGKMNHRSQHTVYVDDDKISGEFIVNESHSRFIHFYGQAPHVLWSQLWTP